MSKLNVEIVKLAHLLRKYRCKMIFITVRAKDVDSSIRDPELLTCEIEKTSKKTAILKIDGYDTILLRNIPPTTIKFDTYDIAYFSFEDDIEINNGLPKEVEAALIYAEKGKLKEVQENFDLPFLEQAKNLVRKGIKLLFEKSTFKNAEVEV